jgi:aminopeptidase
MYGIASLKVKESEGMNMEEIVNHIVDTLVQLVSIPSPSGFTQEIIRFIERKMERYGVPMTRNHKGGLLMTLEGADHRKQRVLTAHVDTLGAMVKEIKANGRLKLSMIGGYAWNAIEGEYCNIHTAKNGVITGTIMIDKASVHVHGDETRKAERSQETIEVRIDAKVADREGVEALGIRVGDFVSFDPRVKVTEHGFIKSRHLDDKASVAILLELISQIKEQGIEIPHTTHILISNHEEIGYGGNSNIPPETVEYLAVDMGAIGAGQASDEYTVSICAKDSSGPYHYGFRQKLVDLAEREGIAYKIDIYPHYGSDASAALRAGFDIVHGLIGPGIDASHSFERTHRDSLKETYRLLLAYIQSEMDDYTKV